MDTCVCCVRELPTECGSMVCEHCLSNTVNYAVNYASIAEPLTNNVSLSFNGGHNAADFSIGYRRKKPLNKLQIWMFKVCFGIEARNI